MTLSNKLAEDISNGCDFNEAIQALKDTKLFGEEEYQELCNDIRKKQLRYEGIYA